MSRRRHSLLERLSLEFLRLVCIAATSTCLLPGSAASAKVAPDSVIERLEATRDAFPDDPDLQWALARAYADADQSEAAAEHMREFISRWPDRRPDAHFELGRMLFRAERLEEALTAFAAAIAAQSESGPAHFYRALVLRELTRRGEADAAFARAIEFSPTLEPEALLLRALDLFEFGNDVAAESLLRRLLEIEPTGETAERARLLLADARPLDREHWYRADARAGFEWDSNPLLDPSGGGLQALDDGDGRAVIEVGFGVRAPKLHGFGADAGYRLQAGWHLDEVDYDYLANMAFATGHYAIRENIVAALSGVFLHLRQDDSDYYYTGSLRPQLVVSFGERVGATRLFAEVGWHRFDDPPAVSALERDAIFYGAGFEHLVRLFYPGATAKFGARFERSDTESDWLHPFDGDYDRDLWEGRLSVDLPLPWQLQGRLTAIVGHERYENVNLQHFLTNFEKKKRRDTLGELRISLVRPIVDHIEVELSWRGTHSVSNLELFEYDRQIVGAYLRITTD